MTTVESPLQLPAPNDGMQRIRRFARDLAWGALNGKWGTTIDKNALFQIYIRNTWEEKPPDFQLLRTLGYLIFEDAQWRLTAKAFDLLNEPTPLEIFISYSRAVSSALAILIWAELRTDGYQPFLDIRNIALGDEWEDVLEQRVRNSNIFISVIGPKTIDSPYIQAEIEWALDTPTCRLIPVLHGGFTPGDLDGTPYAVLQEKNMIVIPEERALAFYNALQQIRGALGLLR